MADLIQDQAQDQKLFEVQHENRYLKETIIALRSELESLAFEKEQSVRDTIASMVGEISHLKKTITALRDELEQQKHVYEEKIYCGKQDNRDEKNQLEAIIQALRTKLETNPYGKYRGK